MEKFQNGGAAFIHIITAKKWVQQQLTHLFPVHLFSTPGGRERVRWEQIG